MRDEFRELIEEKDLQFIRTLWCDNGNVIRGKAVHRDRFSTCVRHGVGISAAQQSVPATRDVPAPGSGYGPVGEIRLVPDLATLTVLPYSPGHARVMGNMVLDGAPWPLCPRAFLQRMVSAVGEAGFTVMAAFENEFYLLEPTADGHRPADATNFAASLAMDLHAPVIDGIADALVAQGITIEQYYPESGPGQQEISILYADPMRAADQQILFRETVHAIARKHGLRATFLPKPFEDKAGSGCHLHLSLWQGGEPLPAAPSGPLPLAAQRFMAGILHHLPALMAVTTPSPNSYRRIRPHCWSGAFRCWGVDNREAALRVPTHPAGAYPSHFEFKTVDAAANPYLALGATLAAGLDGINREMTLPDPVAVDPGLMPEAERQARGIDLLPQSLGEALAQLESDWVLLDALGGGLARAYLAVRRSEWEEMREWTIEREAEALLERY